MGICGVCDKQRNTTRVVNSKLLGIPFVTCNSCATAGFEPRYIVILAARSGKMDAARPYIQNHLYVGEEIPALDIV